MARVIFNFLVDRTPKHNILVSYCLGINTIGLMTGLDCCAGQIMIIDEIVTIYKYVSHVMIVNGNRVIDINSPSFFDELVDACELVYERNYL